MITKSPVYNAIKNIIDLLGLNDKVALFSYRDDFQALWEIDAPIPSTMPIWCVVDDSFGQFRWLPVGVWGHYYRARRKGWTPKLLLVGETDSLNPCSDREALFIPYFYTDHCVKGVSFDGTVFYGDPCEKKSGSGSESVTFLLSFYKAMKELLAIQNMIEGEQDQAEAEKTFGPEAQTIEGWKGIIRNTLSLPQKRHSISNEIAPIELRNAIETLKIKLASESSGHLKEISIINNCLSDHKIDQEKRALLTVWNWVAPYDKQGLPTQTIPPRMKDIWDIWSNAKFMLIDDMGISNGFDKIVKCALALMMKKNYEKINLECRDKLDISSDDLINNYGCLFLDLRLGEKDIEERDHRELSSYKFAVEVADKCPAFPIIIFSSSQQREIDKDLSIYGNIISIFRKPGIAGSSQAIDGDAALQYLFAAVKRAFEMMENRLVYNMIPDSSDYYYLKYKNMDKIEASKQIQLNRDDQKELFKQVFWFGRYNMAFTFPYSFLESQFADADEKDLLFISQIGLMGDPDKVLIENGDLVQKAEELRQSRKVKSNTKITVLDKSRLKLKDFALDQWTPNLNLNLRVLHVVRNLYSHRIHKYGDMRQVAIVVLLLFLAVLKNDNGQEKDYATLGELELVNKFPLIFPCKDSNVNTFISEVLSLASYYGKSTVYNRMYVLVTTSGN